MAPVSKFPAGNTNDLQHPPDLDELPDLEWDADRLARELRAVLRKRDYLRALRDVAGLSPVERRARFYVVPGGGLA